MARTTKTDPGPRRKGGFGKALRLFSIIFLILLVPVVLDQVEVDPETVRITGRVAASVAGVLFLYGIFTKLLKVLGFVVAALTVVVVLVSEDVIELPRLTALMESRQEGQ